MPPRPEPRRASALPASARLALRALALALLFVLACRDGAARAPAGATSEAPATPAEPGAPHALVLVSIDGLPADALERFDAPHLARFASQGVRAEALVPVFPTSTFPNHTTIVTGLWPDRHGVVGNTMFDPELRQTFRISEPEKVGDGRWWGGEPLWVTVEEQGGTAAMLFWPGSEAEIGGVRPTSWTDYDESMPGEERVARVLSWLDRPPGERATFLTLYFSAVDSAGHRFGPDAPEVGEALRETDAHLGTFLAGLEERGIAETTDVVVLSDHGMAARSHERVIVLDELVDRELLEGAHLVTLSPVLGIRATGARRAALLDALRGAHPHLAVWAREDVPERLHHRDHRRIPDVVGLADVGWRVALSEHLERMAERPPGGAHGYDPAEPAMHAFFAARGPSFRRGATVPPFENVHLYELFTRLLGLRPAPNDGDPRALLHLLAPDGPSGAPALVPGRDERR